MSDNRRKPRQRILKGGRIDFGAGAVDCVVRNLSETGAALEVESPIGIPQTFDLIIIADRSRKRSQVVWRKERRLGVRFS